MNSVSETLPLPSASAWVWLRIRSDNTAFDAELQGLIDAAKQDLRRRGIKAAEMSAVGASIFSFEPRSAVAKAYEQFTKEVLEHEKCREKYPTRQL
mgnify:CR=1 FL=1